MFALAIWDRTVKRLVLARDRLGIKPLFYSSAGPRGFGFASEIKALLAARMSRREVDPDALLHYLSCGYVPGTATIYRDVHRLAPGELLVLDAGGLRRRPHWTLRPREPLRSSSAAPEELRVLLTAAVHEQLVSDVPPGPLLSHGLHYHLGEAYAAWAPGPLGCVLGQAASVAPAGRGNRLEETVRKLRRLADGGGIADTGRRYARWAKVCGEAEVRALVPDVSPGRTATDLFGAEARRCAALDHGDRINRMLYTDCRLGLPGDMLAKVDMASMANALEVPVPFLDHRVVEYAFRVPGRWKIGAMRGKRILRHAFRDVLPPEVVRRSKRGFEPPA